MVAKFCRMGLLVLLGIHGALLFQARLRASQIPPSFPKYENAEAAFALEQRIVFSRASIYELELIPGISDTLAFRIEAARPAILSAAAGESSKTRHLAFTTVHGIGEEIAQKLNKYLELDFKMAQIVDNGDQANGKLKQKIDKKSPRSLLRGPEI